MFTDALLRRRVYKSYVHCLSTQIDVWSHYALQDAIESLRNNGAFYVHTIQKTFTDTNGKQYRIVIPKAAETDMWPMGTHVWIRDIAFGADRVLQVAALTNDSLLLKEGKTLLISALTLMSTVSQLQKFSQMIAHQDAAFASQAEYWPQIFLEIESNLHGAQYEPWAHKQDAWQALAVATFRALHCSQIEVADLQPEHIQFLAATAPFLLAVHYYGQPNSGSWEELEAVRSSVLSFDTTLLAEYIQVLSSENGSWLVEASATYWNNCSVSTVDEFIAYLQAGYVNGLLVLQKQLPFESPNYDVGDPRYRESDAALLYILLNNSLQQISDVQGKSADWVYAQEQLILKQVLSLQCKTTGAIARYNNDSYQRFGFFRPTIVKKLRKYYGSQSGEASSLQDFIQRNVIVPKGKEAVWTHFVWQLSWWAGRKFLQTNEPYWQELQRSQMQYGIQFFTQPGMLTLEVLPNGSVKTTVLPAYKLPECFIAEAWLGKQFKYASPHTPLNWSTREAQLAFAYLQSTYPSD